MPAESKISNVDQRVKQLILKIARSDFFKTKRAIRIQTIQDVEVTDDNNVLTGKLVPIYINNVERANAKFFRRKSDGKFVMTLEVPMTSYSRDSIGMRVGDVTQKLRKERGETNFKAKASRGTENTKSGGTLEVATSNFQTFTQMVEKELKNFVNQGKEEMSADALDANSNKFSPAPIASPFSIKNEGKIAVPKFINESLIENKENVVKFEFLGDGAGLYAIVDTHSSTGNVLSSLFATKNESNEEEGDDHIISSFVKPLDSENISELRAIFDDDHESAIRMAMKKFGATPIFKGGSPKLFVKKKEDANKMYDFLTNQMIKVSKPQIGYMAFYIEVPDQFQRMPEFTRAKVSESILDIAGPISEDVASIMIDENKSIIAVLKANNRKEALEIVKEALSSNGYEADIAHGSIRICKMN